MTQSIEIHMLPSQTTDLAVMEQITNIVNRVYAASEEGLWIDGVVRTTVAETMELTRSGEIAVAQSMGKIVGCVRIRQVDRDTGEFGMLAVDESYQGAGIGRQLIHFAEQTCKSKHLQYMQLELLVPQKGSHPAKEVLAEWYSRLGYSPVHKTSIESSFPHLAHMLAIPCDIKKYYRPH